MHGRSPERRAVVHEHVTARSWSNAKQIRLESRLAALGRRAGRWRAAATAAAATAAAAAAAAAASAPEAALEQSRWSSPCKPLADVRRRPRRHRRRRRRLQLLLAVREEEAVKCGTSLGGLLPRRSSGRERRPAAVGRTSRRACAHGPVADLLGLVRILCVCTAARDDVREGLDVGARGLESDGLQVGIHGLLHSAQCGRGMPNAAPCTAPIWPRVQRRPRVGQRLLPEPDLRQAGGAVRQRDGDRGPVDLRLGLPGGPQVVQSSGVARGRSEEVTMLEGGIPDVLPGRRQLRNNSFPPHDGGVTPQEGSPFASGLFAPLSQCLSIGAHRLLVQPLAARPKIQSSIVLCHKLGVCRLVSGRSILPTSRRRCQSSWQHSPGCLQKVKASGLQHWHKLQP
mmetsp:Transcript_24333/g.68326  ORF Transcript_24333/g.68326 Transcript_24333/m.68326 type:complete len:398 (-) Transcript_24333:417-1610(-)